MERFPIYEIERPGDADLPGYMARSFERHGLDWLLAGTVVAPEGSKLFIGQRSGVLRLWVPAAAELNGPCYLYPGDAMSSARIGEHGLAWEPAVAPVDVPEGVPTP